MVKKIAFVAIALFLFASVARAAAIDDAREARLDGNMTQAADILNKAAAADPPQADLYMYLQADTLALQKKYPEAIAVLDKLLVDFVKSKYYYKALFKKAECLIALGKLDDADAIFEGQSARIFGEDRKLRIAGIYIAYADSYFKPADKDKQPDYAMAEQFYTRTLQFGISDDKMFSVRMRIAMCQYNTGRLGEAAANFASLLEKKDLPADIEMDSMYYLGLSYISQNQMGKARNAFKKLLEKYPNSPNAPKAAFNMGRTYGMPNPASLKNLELGVKALKDYIEKYPTHENAPAAAYQIAQAYYNMKRYEEAIAALGNLIDLFGKRTDLEEVPQAKILLGRCYYDQEKYTDAIIAWKKYLAEHPTHKGWSDTSSSIIDAEYSIALKALREKRYADAVDGFQKFIDAHPLDSRAIDAMYQLGDIENQKGNYKDAISLWEKLVSKYPDSGSASQAQLNIGDINEKKFNDPEAALAAYKKVTGSYYGEAQSRIAAMLKKQLTVLTERAFNTNEKPALKITARNIQKLQFRAYKIDIESYFKKYHDFRGIENLDIALIDPDKTWEYEVKDYKKMQTYYLSVEMPFTEEGVYAITCGDDDLEATTMLLVTNVAVVIKSSKKNAFIFAEDMRTGKPSEGVRVLISNGDEVVEAGKTAGDGVLQYKSDKQFDSNLTVLALMGKSASSDKLYTGDLSYTETSKNKGIIFTDRPAYKPGQTVNAKGILRDISGGVYKFKSGELWKVAILAPGGVALDSKTLELSEFGTFSIDYTVSADAPVGDYSIQAVRVDDKESPVYNTTFKVEEYKLERIKLSAETGMNIYFRGETLKGKFKAEYYFGQPVTGKKIEYRIGNQKTASAETDKDGIVEFSLDTSDFEENAVISIYGTIPGENVAASKNVWVAATEFDMTVSTLRDVYLAGESAEVTVKSRDLEGKPVKSDVRLEVLQRITVGGTTSEVRVSDEPMKESAKGTSVSTVKLAKGGYYVLRAFARDRFNNPIAAEKQIFVSGEEDENRLRIITEREEFRVGETPSLKVVYREKPALALVTFEGDSIYRYKLVTIDKGENSLPLDITDELAPNFTLGIAVMNDNKFFQTDKSFSVIKGLQISLEPEKDTYMPGDKMKLTVKTTDQNGKPVKAEISLALVDEALYTLYADQVPPLGEFFFGEKRAGSFKTTSSNTFNYAAATKEVSKDLVAEEKREEMEADKDEGAGYGAGTAYNGRAKKEAAKPKAAKGGSAYPPSPAAQAMPKMDINGLSATTASEMPEEAEDRTGAYDMVAGEANAPGAPPPPVARLREFFPEAGYWNPSVKTGADGSTEIEITLPDTATKWRLTSRGATVDTLVGEQTANVVTKQDFFVSVKQPASLVEGSKAGFSIEVHNLTKDKRDATISASFEVDGKSEGDTKKISVDANSTTEVLFQFNVPAGKSAILTIDAAASDKADKVKVTIPVSPYGVQIAEVKSGTSSEDATTFISLPAGKEIFYPEMYITLSPSLRRAVLDVDFPGWMSNNQTALDALSVLYRLDYLKDTGGASSPDNALLANRIQGLSMRLITNMYPSGGWTWTRENASRQLTDVSVTCDSVWALALARKRGVVLPQDSLDKAAQFLLTEFGKSGDNNSKAEMLHALSYLKKADFAYLNRLDRERSGLSVKGLSFLALSYANMERPELAAEVAGDIEAKVPKLLERKEPIYYGFEDEKIVPWNTDTTAEMAIAMLALEKSKPSSSSINLLKDRIESLRYGNGWGTAEGTGYAASALAVYYSKTAHASDRYTLTISVNDKEVKTVQADSSSPVVKIEVPNDGFSATGKNKVSFKMTGRGNYGYSVALTGFRKDEEALSWQSTGNNVYVYEKKFIAQPPRFNGKEYAEGYSVSEKNKKNYQYDNGTSEIPLGGYVTVSLHVNKPSEMNELIVVEDTIPAGATIDKDSISGDFAYYQIVGDRILFYCSGYCYQFTYKLYGYLPGDYKSLPMSLYPATNTLRRNYTKSAAVKVLMPGEKTSKEYMLTPDQLYYMGKDFFDAGMKDDAGKYLNRLLDENDLTDDAFKETHRMLMYICIEKSDSKCIVDHFEQLKERYPSLTLDYKDVLRVAKAYRDMNEHERAIQVYRTALESSFQTDGETRIFLEDQGKFFDSLSFLDDLALEYPDLNIVQNAVYSNSQALYGKAANAAAVPEFKEKGLGKNDVIALAIKSLDNFMLFYPASPYMDEAGFSLASAYFDMEQSAKTKELSQKLQKRYPKSPFMDRYLYLEAYADFELGDYETALALCKKVTEDKFYNSAGELAESGSKNLALYIMAQIYHATNKPDKAAEYYEKVSGSFTDAAGALEYFNRKTFSIPELTTTLTGKSGKIVLTHRNVEEAEIMVYRVDLMKFYLLRKSLKGMAQIQLAGVKPIFEKKLPLSKVREYRDTTTDIEIPLDRDGAYLVMMKAGSLYTSGMLLRTNLEVEVQEDAVSGGVRVNVMDARTGKYVSKAHVKVVGSGDGRIQSGSTDLRGIFTADAVSGLATVIVKNEDQFAFHSGETMLQTAYNQAPAQPAQIDYMKMRGQNTQNIMMDNAAIQQRNSGYIRENLQRKQGVQIEDIQQNMNVQEQMNINQEYK